ncbi:hypothetical protein R3P38DRAFT_968914 [Favolaschia claudopus]|uniref:G-protein coupled receptors family 1 profile domain-containing protein n=1 Tax=Favolaschia claudopus TaxID=2862362 RepID=A0AAW0E621_9AGAR
MENSPGSAQAGSLSLKVTVFNISVLLGVVSLGFIAATAYFASTVHRSQLWFRHIFSWIVYSVAFLFLVGHQGGSNPPFGLCFFQSALIYAVPTYPTLSALAFVADLYIRLSAIIFNKRKIHPSFTKFLVAFPPVVLLAVFIEAMVSVQDPAVVELEGNLLYCHVSSLQPTLVSSYIIIITGIIIFPLEIWIAVMLYRNWRLFRSSSGPDQQLFLTMFVRVVLFTIISMSGVGLSSMSLGAPNGMKPYWTRLVLTIGTFGS